MAVMIRLRDVNGLAGKLRRMSAVRFEAVVKKSMAQIYQRAQLNSKQGGIGTPIDSGELRASLSMQGDVVGYAKTYAPHVEYGHRTRGGGYVKGQRFLKKNVDKQRPVFKRDIIEQIRRA